MKRKMKRRLCSLLLAFALLPAVALAEVVGRDGMYADRYIHRIEAPNGTGAVLSFYGRRCVCNRSGREL